jgi:hypothetical protein
MIKGEREKKSLLVFSKTKQNRSYLVSWYQGEKGGYEGRV